VKGRAYPPAGSPGPPADPCGFAVSADRDAAQITVRGRPTEAAGGASLTPVPGVELVFDRVSGGLSTMIVTAGEPGGAMAAGEEAVAYLAGVFGSRIARAVREAPRRAGWAMARPTQPEAVAALSRLARLDAARATSPVPASPLWAAEAADLARCAGLPGRAEADRGSAMVSAGLGPPIPAEVLRMTRVAGGARPGRGPQPGHGARQPGGWLDLGLVPGGVFQPGLWPESDLGIRTGPDGAPIITVEAVLLAGAAPEALAACRARLVDADARRVLATAALRVCTPAQAGAPLRVRAELPAPGGLRALAWAGAAWVEVVDDERRPVHGTRLRGIRRTLRWADAALRAESRPCGLAPELSGEQWSRLARLAWDRCRLGWEAAGDPGRMGQAAARAGALCGAAVRRARPFLAELACGPRR
jgi:hypothetical protein